MLLQQASRITAMDVAESFEYSNGLFTFCIAQGAWLSNNTLSTPPKELTEIPGKQS
ncbi:MAG: hypothetical protein U0003_03700 [Vampirovibrionales bacterium]